MGVAVARRRIFKMFVLLLMFGALFVLTLLPGPLMGGTKAGGPAFLRARPEQRDLPFQLLPTAVGTNGLRRGREV